MIDFIALTDVNASKEAMERAAVQADNSLSRGVGSRLLPLSA